MKLSEIDINARARVFLLWLQVSIAVGSLGVVGWIQTAGEGLQAAAQSFLGIDILASRIDNLEKFMPPPAVVEWNEAATRQAGECTSRKCEYALTGARTPYGESCGKPISVEPFLRLSDGRVIQLSPINPIELSRQLTTFTVSLVIPSYVPQGTHQWQARVLYPSCLGINEPLPRLTPWFPVSIIHP